MHDPWDQLLTDQLAAFAAQVSVHTPAHLRTLLAATNNEAASLVLWQPGILHLFGRLPDLGTTESYLGGLTREHTLFVLVPASLVNARRAAWIEQLARAEMIRLHLPIDDPVRVQIYCDQAWQDILQDPNPRPHIAFEADAQARQVLNWLRLLKDRCCLPVATE